MRKILVRSLSIKMAGVGAEAPVTVLHGFPPTVGGDDDEHLCASLGHPVEVGSSPEPTPLSQAVPAEAREREMYYTFPATQAHAGAAKSSLGRS